MSKYNQTSNLANLPPELIQKTALTMSPSEILKLCRVDKRFNNAICNNEYFWILKLKRDLNKTYKCYSAKEIYLETTNWNKDLVEILHILLNFKEFAFEKQKYYYAKIVREMKEFFKKKMVSTKIVYQRELELNFEEGEEYLNRIKKQLYANDYAIDNNELVDFLIAFFSFNNPFYVVWRGHGRDGEGFLFELINESALDSKLIAAYTKITGIKVIEWDIISFVL